MSERDKFQSLRIEIGFGVGLTQAPASRPITAREQQEALHIIINDATESFGGCTLYRCRGCWKSPANGVTYREEGRTLLILCKKGPNVKAKLKRLVKCIKKALDQEAVFVTVTRCSSRLV